MKLFITAALLSSTVSVSALAAYDDFDCRASASLKNAYLDCVSCGAQKYYSDKYPDKEVVPSEKWLAFLGVMTKQTSHLAPSRSDGRFSSKDNDIVSNFDAREAYQRKVIAQVQAYGFCTKFVGKKNKGGKELSSDDWKVIFSYLTTSKNASEAELEKLADFFGFDNPHLGSRAESNMRYLATGKRVNPANENGHNRLPDFSEVPKDQRRPNFRKRLSEILGSDYDVSGERSNTRSAIAGGDKSTGLKECLEEIRDMHEGRSNSFSANAYRNDANYYEFCATMANSCDMSPSFCAGKPLPSATTKPVQNRNIVAKEIPPGTSVPSAPSVTAAPAKSKSTEDQLPAPLVESSQHSMDALPNPSSGTR